MQTENFRYSSPIGTLYLTLFEDSLFELAYETDQPERFSDHLPAGSIHRWLDRYFATANSSDVPSLKMRGTAFQRKVWQAMLDIPAGRTKSYGEIARVLGTAPRAVGQACRSNHLPIVIPCHRIVASGSIVGYEGSTSGHRLERKSWLLEHEKNHTQIA